MDEDGSALVAVLVVILLLTLLLGSVLATDRLGSRIVAGDLHARQALLAAEGGLELARARLRGNALFQGDIPEVTLQNGARASATVSAHGIYVLAIGRGQSGRRSAEVHVLLGTEATAPFQAALWIGDPHGGVNVGGATTITGRVVVGRAGYEENRFNRRGFSGEHVGELIASDSVTFPEWSPSVLQAWRAGRSEPIAATNTLILDGPITGRNLVFYAEKGIVIGPEFSGSGQFISDGFILIMGGARLNFPSVVLATRVGPGRTVTVRTGARVEGLVMATSDGPGVSGLDRSGLVAPVTVEPGARIVGGIYSDVPLNMSGRVDGSVVTRNLQFYVSPTVYVNWLVNAQIDHDSRPHPFIIPPGLAEQPSWTPLTRERRTTTAFRQSHDS